MSKTIENIKVCIETGMVCFVDITKIGFTDKCRNEFCISSLKDGAEFSFSGVKKEVLDMVIKALYLKKPLVVEFFYTGANLLHKASILGEEEVIDLSDLFPLKYLELKKDFDLEISRQKVTM